MKRIGLFGGTFDPIHFGHLRSATEIQQLLQLDGVEFIPCHIPPHKEQPRSSGEHRYNMVASAIADTPSFSLNDIELQRQTASYTLNTLQALRTQYGPSHCLCFIMGMDSLVSLESWYRWRSLTDYCHLVVALRPGSSLSVLNKSLSDFIKSRQRPWNEVNHLSQGHIIICETTELDISSTQIRQQLTTASNPRQLVPQLVPQVVLDYIEQHNLYRDTTTETRQKGPPYR